MQNYVRDQLGVHTKVTNAAVMGELGRFRIMINFIYYILNYWQHLDKPGYSTKLLEVAKSEMLRLADKKATWVYVIKQIFSYSKWSGIITHRAKLQSGS